MRLRLAFRAFVGPMYMHTAPRFLSASRSHPPVCQGSRDGLSVNQFRAPTLLGVSPLHSAPKLFFGRRSRQEAARYGEGEIAFC